MIRQSLIDERHSDLALSDSTNRRLHRITAFGDKNPSHLHIRKNNRLINNNNTNDQQSQETTDSSPSSQYYEQQSDFSPFSPSIDPRQRIDHLERNIKYIQQQHEQTLQDLHHEVDRLQQENRDLHFHLINIRPSSRNNNSDVLSQITTITANGTVDRSRTKAMGTTTRAPTVAQMADLSKLETNLEKRLQEVQRLYFEKQIEELKQKVVELERKNEYLVRTIDDLKKRTVAVLSVPPTVTFQPSPPQPLFPEIDKSIKSQDTQMVPITHNKLFSPVSLSSITSLDPLQVTIEPNSVSREPTPEECIQLIRVAHEAYKNQVQEISVMKAILKELLRNEHLSLTSRTLVRDCLAASTSSDISFSQKTARFVPNDGLIKRQLSSSSKRTTDYLHARHLESRGTVRLRRLTLSPPNLSMNLLSGWSGSTRPSDRLILPPIQQGSTPIHESPLHHHHRKSDTNTDNSQSLNSLLNQSIQQQQANSRFNETTVARRERRTQELQRIRLTRNLYH